MWISVAILSIITLLVSNTEAGTYTYEYYDQVISSASSTTSPIGDTIYTFNFNNIYEAKIRPLNSTHIEFQLSVKTTGFVGFGIESASGQGIKDCVIAGVNDTTYKPYVYDMYVPSTNTLTFDTKKESDWVVTSAFQNAEYTHYTVLTLVRRFKTTDQNPNQDIEIKNETVNIRWLYGDEDTVGHGIKKQVAIGGVNFIRDGTGSLNNSALLHGSSTFIASLIAALLFCSS